MFYSVFCVKDCSDEDFFVSKLDSLGFFDKFSFSSMLVYRLNLLNPFTFL